MLTIHHLGTSQSERIVWLCEELGVPYELRHHARDPVTRLSPPALKELHPLGAAPVIEDGGRMLAESGAIVEYILEKHGGGRLKLGPADPAFADYLYWFHFANANLQAVMGRLLYLQRAGVAEDNPVLTGTRGKLALLLGLMDERVARLPYLAGEAFTAADVMTLFSLTTMRRFLPLDLAPYPGLRAYIQRLAARQAYQRAMAKADPGVAPLLD